MSEQSTPNRANQLQRLTKAQLVELLLDAESKQAEPSADEITHQERLLIIRVLALLWSMLFRVRHSSGKVLVDRTFRLELDALLRDSAAVGYRNREELKEAMGSDLNSYNHLAHAMNFEGWEQAAKMVEERGLAQTAVDLVKKQKEAVVGGD